MSTILLSHLGHLISSFTLKFLNLYLKNNVQRLISRSIFFCKYMANFKLTISDIKGKSLSKELKDSDANPLLGLQLGNETDASIVGLNGKLKLTGGSDKSGVPMRNDIHGAARKYVLLSKGVGLQNAETGQRVRKLMRGNTVSEEIYQVNCKFDGELPVEKANDESENTDDSAQDKKE